MTKIIIVALSFFVASVSCAGDSVSQPYRP